MLDAQCGVQVNAMLRRWPHDVLCTSHGRLGDLFGMIMSTSDPDKDKWTWSCVIDGLDHCEISEREKLLLVFAKGFEADESAWNLRLLILSRPCGEIKTKIQTWENARIQAFISNKSDIAKYIDDKVSTFRHYTPEQTTKTIEILKSGVNGSFEYAVHIIEALKHGSSDYAYKPLDIPLPRMDEALADLVDRATPRQLVLLQMLAVLERLPSVSAFTTISQIRGSPFSDYFDFGGKDDTIGHIVLSEEALRVSNGHIRFAYPTMKEYICRQMTQSQLQNIHGKIAQTCLLYLATVGLETHPIACPFPEQFAKEFNMLMTTSPYLDYAANFWSYHVENAGPDPMELWDSIQHAFSIEDVRGLAFRVYRFRRLEEYIGGQSLLHILVHHGLVSLTEMVLSSKEIYKITVDDRDAKGRTALWWAVDTKNEAMVKLLLETDGVSLDCHDEDKITPAVHAIILGHAEVLHLFLKSGKINWAQKDQTGRTLLAWAAKIGRRHVVAELLQIDACVNTIEQKCPDQTALVLAARHGFKDVVELLLEKNADPNSVDTESGRSALSWAAGNGHKGVVAMLLENQIIELDQRDVKFERTAFHWAAHYEYRKIADMILNTIIHRDESGASDKTQSLLFEAAQHGQDIALEILLYNESAQVDPDCMLESRTPLSLAAEHGHRQVFDLLLSTGRVNINSADSSGRTAKDWAEIRSRGEILKLIKDAEILQNKPRTTTT